jgi:hypothetical protein
VVTLRENAESESDSSNEYFQDSEASSEHDSEHDSEHRSEHNSEYGSEHNSEHRSEHDSEHESEHEHDPEPELTNEIMQLCILVITQETGDIPQYDSPLMHFLAVCGIDANSTKLRNSMSYTPILAGALWIIRLLMLEFALPAKPWPTLGLQHPNSSSLVIKIITQIRSKHLCEGTYSPTSTLLAQLAYGKWLNRHISSNSNIHWSSDENTLFYLGLPIELSKIRTMWSALIGQLQELLLQLALGEALPKIDLKSIIDSTSSVGQLANNGYSFMDHRENRSMLGHRNKRHQFLLFRARDQHAHTRAQGRSHSRSHAKAKSIFKLLQPVVGRKHELQWRMHQCHSYLSYEREFLLLLMACMHITGGQPARGPELGSLKITNSRYSIRNIYAINGNIAFLTTYDKSLKKRGIVEYILRVLPPQIGQILAQYLVYVHPFARSIDKNDTEYLFSDKNDPWVGDHLTRKLKSLSRMHLGVELTTQSWRHVAIAIANKHIIMPIDPEFRVWEPEYDGDDDEALEGVDELEAERNAISDAVIR